MACPGVSEGETRWGRVNSSGLAGVNSVGRLWAMGVVSGCLAPGPWVMKAEEYSLLECMGQRGDLNWLVFISKTLWALCYLEELASPGKDSLLQPGRFFKISKHNVQKI